MLPPLRLITFIRNGYARFLEAQQLRLANNYDGLLQLAILGLICGVLSGGVIILFRLSMDEVAQGILPFGSIEGFEQLSALQRCLLCAGGGLLLGLFLQSLKPKNRSVGVVHVIERLDYHQGYLPIKNAIVQFIGGFIALISGQSTGREGPSIHLGAASGSMLGRLLRVPHNSVRTLVACGVAAAISAAFNTPLAGVIFAMEVVIMEYTVIGFTPVILAAVSATTLTHFVFGNDIVLKVAYANINSLTEMPIILLMGVLIGCLAALFIHLTVLISSLFAKQSIILRCTLAGVLTGLVAIAVPQVMGSGYDTVDLLLMSQIGLVTAVLITFAKILTTSAATSLGIPAGLIGPTLLIGAAAGSVIGLLAALMFDNTADAGFYALLGMAAMMGATLQAPLAALIFLVELSASHAIIMPGMAVVVTASLIANVVFKKSSIYRHLMQINGQDYRNSDLAKSLRRVGVASVMDRDIIQHQQQISIKNAQALLQCEPRWLLINNPKEQHSSSLLPASDLAVYVNELLDEACQESMKHNVEKSDVEQELNLCNIPAKRLDAGMVNILATLQEAYERMQKQQCEVLIVTGAHGESKNRVYGVITREHIESSYRV